MNKKTLAIAMILLVFRTSYSQLVESGLEGFQVLASEHSNILVGIAFAAVVFTVTKKVNPFNTYYKKDNKIPIALGIAVFFFTIIAIPRLSLPGIDFAGKNVPGLVVSIIFVLIVLWLLKEKKIESNEWKFFSLMIVSGVLAFVLSYFNMLLLSGLASMSMLGFMILFLIFMLKTLD